MMVSSRYNGAAMAVVHGVTIGQGVLVGVFSHFATTKTRR
jgi:carbonic anhydrase/acetyltransferase-like protein (isoleucine patch superfamily)